MDIAVTYKNGVVEMYTDAKEVKSKDDDKFLKFSTEKVMLGYKKKRNS